MLGDYLLKGYFYNSLFYCVQSVDGLLIMILLLRRVVCGLYLTFISLSTVYAEEIQFLKQQLVINQIKIQVEVAETNTQRQQGLMGRATLADGDGMLFVLDEETLPCFWMKDTFIPLSLAFISTDKKIVQLAELTPKDEHHVCAKSPISYALEVPQGWFEKQGITIGSLVEGINHSINE